MQFQFNSHQEATSDTYCLTVAGRQVPLLLVRNARARRYILRLRSDGSVRLTLPSRGSVAEGWRFAERNTPWLERQLARQAARPAFPREWQVGDSVLFRGIVEPIRLTPEGSGVAVHVGNIVMRLKDVAGNLRPSLERAFWKVARQELPTRVLHYAHHGFRVGRVSVRNQRSRWGSCSRTGTISLNWRLIQAPQSVQDYIILHELMHLRHMNHSARYWQAVAQVCPDYRDAERWLKQHASILR